ncbi:hypothetical protein HKI87_15g80760 [Chloropicon roscoffensis]|uniref:Uncharacterized protein n=1 Tax=Chloropicon roscoffensis TaxID=1461544 RepID=A0AAX4PJL3_9CHLO
MSKEFLRELHRNTEEGGLAVLNVMQVQGERKDMLERDAKAYFKAVEFQPVGPWAQNGNSYVITLKNLIGAMNFIPPKERGLQVLTSFRKGLQGLGLFELREQPGIGVTDGSILFFLHKR